MIFRTLGATILSLGLLACPLSEAHASKNCEDQGFTCANLVYQGFTYPYERPEESYLYVNSGVYPYHKVTNNLLGDSTVRLPDNNVITVEKLLTILGLEEKSGGKLSPVVGYGSNPAPVQLERKFTAKKFQGDVVVPVMKGQLKDFDVAWTPVFVSYGSMPSTITPSPGTTVDVWITWLDEDAITAMDGTEHANPAERPLYVKTTLKDAEYAFDGPEPAQMEVYVSCFGALTINGKTLAVKSVPARGRKFEPANSPEALGAVVPILGWELDVVQLLFDNVVSPRSRAERSTRLKPYGPFPDIPEAEGLAACKQSRAGAEKPY